MNRQHPVVRLFLGPLFLLWGAALTAQAATVAYPANDSLAAAGAWRNVANCFADDALYATAPARTMAAITSGWDWPIRPTR